jgi:hypothetical protein
MISPHTAPGTKVAFLEEPWSHARDCNDSGLREGDVVTVVSIRPSHKMIAGFGALLEEHKGLFDLALLRPLELPKSITDCLDAQPIDFDAEIRERDIAVIKHLMPY